MLRQLLHRTKKIDLYFRGVNGPPLLTFFERERELDSTDPKLHVSEGNTRRLLRESEDDETPQRAFFASEEAHREPAESVVYFQSGSGILLHSL